MISMIACIDKEFGIGKDNNLLYNIKEDMNFFKTTTMGKKVVMGYNTCLSIGRVLPGRENIVLTNGDIPEGFIKSTKEEIIKKYIDSEEEIFIIGGAFTYSDFINISTNLYLTKVDSVKKADTFFPKFNSEDYIKTIINSGKTKDNIEYMMFKYTKKLL